MRRPMTFTLQMSDEDIERIASHAARLVLEHVRGEPVSPYLTVPEAAELLRCRRQRVDDLLSQRRLTRVKDGGRTLIARSELEAYLRGEPTGSSTRAPRRVA
jgi:excisionase family DNA binding protein